MASRGGRSAVRIETDIEKSREDSNWKKVIELAEQLKVRSPANGNYIMCNVIALCTSPLHLSFNAVRFIGFNRVRNDIIRTNHSLFIYGPFLFFFYYLYVYVVNHLYF